MAPPAAAVTPAQREQAASLRDAVMDSGANADKMLRMSQQLADLDTKLAALDSWRVQQSRQLAQAQAQAEDAERDRFGAGWVAALGALAALLAMVVAWLWRERQRAQPGHGAWFIPDLPEPLPAAVAAPRAGVDGVPEWQHSGPRTWPPAEVATAPQAEREPARAAPAPAAGAQPAATSDSAPPRAAAPAWGQALSLDKEVFSKPLSGQEQVQVDEMMDSGHLADFFISIGNLDQAIEVMRKALSDRSSGLLALPYLYLFDLYRQTGRQEDYAALLEQFAHRFNVRIPGWDEEVAEEPRDLESYPRAIALICETWDLPPMVTVIERMLLDDPNKPRVGFDLPAYRDLLDLYAVARDLSRNPAPPEFVRHAGPVRGPDELDFPLDLGAATAPVQDAAAADASRAAALPEIAGMAPAASSEIDAAGPARHLPALDFTLDEPAAVGAAPAPAQAPAPDSGAA
jgi:tetratricopeptide (TPR) repeat protein